MREFRELAEIEARRLLPENQLDGTARDRCDYTQMLWVKLEGVAFNRKHGKPRNRRHWYNRVARNQAMSFARERQRIPTHVGLTQQIMDSMTCDPHVDHNHFLAQLLDSPVADDVKLLLKLIDHDFSVKSLWEFEQDQLQVTLRAFRYRVASARKRVLNWCFKNKKGCNYE